MPSTSQSLLNYLRAVAGAWRDDPRDDADLLARFAEGSDEAAFRVLVWRHGPLVWRTCRGILGDTPDAEDAFQAAFLSLVRKAGRFPVESLAGWLHQVARQAALNAAAGTRRRQDLEQRLRAVKQQETEEEDVASRAELYAVLDEELAGLPERLRVPLLLHHLEGKSQIEVARFLGCSRGVVQYRLARAEAALRKRLERRGLGVGVVSVGALLASPVAVSAVPARLIGSTARAAVAFRSGTLTGRTAEAAWAVLGALPSSLEATIMRKGLWIVLACVCSLGVGLAAWQALSARSEAVEAPESKASPKVTAEPGSKQMDRRSDPLPPGALARLGTLCLRHVGGGLINKDERAESVVFSRDGKVLITAGPGNPIRLWDAATGKLLRSLGDRNNGHGKFIVLSPDGNTLADGHENGDVSLWEVATGKLLRQLGVGHGIDALAFSRDGQTLLSACGDNHLRVWEVARGKVLRDGPLLNAEKAGQPSASFFLPANSFFSPDGKTLASIHNAKGNNILSIWETASGKELRHLSLGKGCILRGAVTFSPDSRFLALSSVTDIDDNRSDGALHLWEVATGKEVRRWTPDKTGTRSVAFSADGKVLATGSGFGPIRLWKVATGKELRQCQGYRAHVVALAFSPDGSMLASLAGLHDHTARLWGAASGKELVRALRGHAGPVLSVSFSADGKSVISGGRDGLVGLWNAETGQEQRPPLRAGDFQALAALAPDGKTIFSVGNSFSSNAQSLTEVLTQSPTLVSVWDKATGQKLRQFQGPVGAPQSLALSPDGKFLILTLYRNWPFHRVYLIEVATGKEMRWFNVPSWATTVSPDSEILTIGYPPGSVKFYATATGKDLGYINTKMYEILISCIAFSPDGQTLAVGGTEIGVSHTIRLWRVQSDKKGWKEAGKLVGHQGNVWGLTFSPDGKTLASASLDGTLRLWEVAACKERCRLAGHCGAVWCVAFAPDGRRLASGGNDTTTLVWDVTGRLQNGQLRTVKLSAQEMKGLWADLTGADAALAGRAVWTLAAAPAQALPLLREYLRPVAPAGPRIARLIADLDSNDFATRQRATDELGKLGEVAGPALRQALAKPASVEMRRRLEQLLEPLEEKFPLSGEKLRTLRAMEVLGQISMPEARQLLEALAQGAPEARLTREAQAILKRLGTRVNATKP